MPVWKRICCAVDFSPVSRKAMESAAELARRYEAELVLVHVDDRPPAPGARDSLAPAAAIEQGSFLLESQLDEWTGAAERIAGRSVSRELLQGAPAESVVRYVSRAGFDAIVMGTHGRTGADHFIFGSVAQAVVRDAPCTVVVVKGLPATGGSPQRPVR
jgi:nucleotide-binding universal stress UspA family protein